MFCSGEKQITTKMFFPEMRVVNDSYERTDRTLNSRLVLRMRQKLELFSRFAHLTTLGRSRGHPIGPD